MSRFRLDSILELLTGVELLVAILWIGLAAITVTLLLLMWTRLGQSHPLRKCLILSFLAHAILAGYATTIEIVFSSPAAEQQEIRIAVADDPMERDAAAAGGNRVEPVELKPWESFVHEVAENPRPEQLARAETEDTRRLERQTASKPSALAGAVDLDYLAMTEAANPQAQPLPEAASGSQPAPTKSAEPIQAPAAQRREAVRAEMPQHAGPRRQETDVARAEGPVRSSQPGVPSSLLERPLPVPRVTEIPKSADPEAPRDWGYDERSVPPRGAPAESMAGVAPPADSRQADVEVGAALAGSSGNSLRPPSTAGSGAAPTAGPAAGGLAAIGPPRLPAPSRSRGQGELPSLYQLRVAPDRSRQAEQHGATEETEEAVRRGLEWLARNQSAGGAWIASQHGAGREMKVGGRDRLNAGMGADTAMTGLALLAMLATGSTHRQGPYQDNIFRGLSYLIETQAADGSLTGQATEYAATYCHGIAMFAMSEAYAMSGDAQLREPVRRAVAYTVAMQNPTTGGWRYRRGDDGDTSQHGWQLMALKSAELAGIPVPEQTWRGAQRFLDSVSYGSYQGLAAYRPGEQVSRPMTAEALVCRQFLGALPVTATAKEAGDYLLGELPGEAKVANLYYWYYGTLAMYQLQGVHWQRWNEALRRTLVASQRKDGPMAGSWDTDTVWGGYGGRVYTTALATLSLEVYYRYLPLYLKGSGGQSSN